MHFTETHKNSLTVVFYMTGILYVHQNNKYRSRPIVKSDILYYWQCSRVAWCNSWRAAAVENDATPTSRNLQRWQLNRSVCSTTSGLRWQFIYTLCSKKSDAKIQITITMAHLIRINYPLSSFNYRLSGRNVANFNKIYHIVSEQQLLKKWNSKTEFSNMENTD